MKTQPPVQIGGVSTAPPVDLVLDTSAGAFQIATQSAPGTVIYDRSVWFEGDGPPPEPDVIGAKPGDCYLDGTTGDVYKLVT